MADHGDSPVVVRGGIILNRFLVFLERLSLEIEEDQLDGLKFLLQKSIPLGHLEKCLTARQLFTRMMQQSLLREDNLDNLEKLFTEVRRHDLVEHVRVYKQSCVQVECELPGNVIYGNTFCEFCVLQGMVTVYFLLRVTHGLCKEISS